MKASDDTAIGAATQPYDSREQATEAFAAHVNRGKARALEAIGVEIVVGEREGPRFRDAYSGRWYWNCHCNGGVFNMGHCNPAVVAAVREGLDHVDVGNHHLVSGWRARLAQQLSDSTGGRLPYAVFTPSGTESVDLALRLARATTGRTKLIAAEGRLPRPQRIRAGRQRSALVRAVRPGPRRVRARPVQRHRRDPRRDRLRHRRGDPRADPGDARLPRRRHRATCARSPTPPARRARW